MYCLIPVSSLWRFQTSRFLQAAGQNFYAIHFAATRKHPLLLLRYLKRNKKANIKIISGNLIFCWSTNSLINWLFQVKKYNLSFLMFYISDTECQRQRNPHWQVSKELKCRWRSSTHTCSYFWPGPLFSILTGRHQNRLITIQHKMKQQYSQ